MKLTIETPFYYAASVKVRCVERDGDWTIVHFDSCTPDGNTDIRYPRQHTESYPDTLAFDTTQFAVGRVFAVAYIPNEAIATVAFTDMEGQPV